MTEASSGHRTNGDGARTAQLRAQPPAGGPRRPRATPSDSILQPAGCLPNMPTQTFAVFLFYLNGCNHTKEAEEEKKLLFSQYVLTVSTR